LEALNFYRIIGNNTNVGDICCCPRDYFDFGVATRELDLAQFDGEGIVGGGGILQNEHRFLQVAKGGKKAVIWGAGLNVEGTEYLFFSKFLDNLGLVGLRDWTNPWQYVPCVTCISPLFDELRDTEPEHDIVCYAHWAGNIDIDAPCINTDGKKEDLVTKLKHLASGRSVISSSYHGIYWALLLQRPVVMIRPFTNKYFGFPCRIPSANKEAAALDLVKRGGAIIPNFLEKCRALNIGFYHQVLRHLTLS